MREFDLIIIGAGIAGYTAAMRASQLRMSVAVVEKNTTLGGTCLNFGCIPSKILLNYSEKYHELLHNYSDIGINTGDVKLDLEKMMGKKNQVVASLCKGIEGLFSKNKITRISGTASILSPTSISVTADSNKQELSAKNIIIATGSSVINIPNINIDEKYIISSTGALNLDKVPEKMTIIGGGYIGLELGSVWSRLGAKITVIENFDTIVPALDREIASQLTKILQKQSIEFLLGTKVISANVISDKVQLKIQKNNADIIETLDTNILLLSVGRKACTDNLNLEKLGMKLDKQNRIIVNSKFQTNIPNIYAVGDVIAGPMLAHKAEEEGIAIAEIIAGKAGHVNYDLIPSVIYTWPEVASVGATEEELKNSKIDYKIGKFPFLANSRAKTAFSTDGMVKILADSVTDKVLGAHIIGPDAGTMIAEITAYMEFGASSEDIARTCHAHPTLSEAIKEAALAVDKRAIHI